MHPGPAFTSLDLVTLHTCCHTFQDLLFIVMLRQSFLMLEHPFVGSCLFYVVYTLVCGGALYLVDSRKLCLGTGPRRRYYRSRARHWRELPSALSSISPTWHLLGSADLPSPPPWCPEGSCAWNSALNELLEPLNKSLWAMFLNAKKG